MALTSKRFSSSGTGNSACVCATVIAIFGATARADFRSPLDDASAVQQQLRQVVDESARSVFAVTAFTAAPTDPAFYANQLDGQAFAALADSLGRSCGSAFAIDSAGHLLTNEHVVSGAQSVWVTDDQGNVLPAVVVGTDPRTDLAVLQIPTATTPLIPASDLPTRGELVVAIGNPDGLATGGELSASVGCISATSRSLPTLSAREHRSYTDLLQMTTPVAVGGSGGPLVGLDGRALGVVSAVATADRDGMPVGFAIPLSQITLARIAKLARGDEVVHPYFGVAIGPADAPSTQPTDRSTPRGARIGRVEANTPADGVLIEGDVVLEVGGKPVESERKFLQLAAACQIDQPVSITVRRAGSLQQLLLLPTRRPLPADPVTKQTQQFIWAGVTFVNDEHAVRVSSVQAGATMPLQPGAIVRRIDGQAVPAVATLARILHANAGQALALDVAGGN